MAESRLPTGPRNLEEFLDYPRRTIRALCRDAGQHERLAKHVARGIILSSDYSGIMSFEDSMLYHAAELVNFGICRDADVHIYKVCDVDATCRRVMASRQSGQPAVMLADIQARLPTWALERIQDLEPPDSETRMAVREHQYDKMLQFLLDNRSTLFNVNAMSSAIDMSNPGKDMEPSMYNFVRSPEQQSPPTERPRRLQGHGSGSICVAWTPRGLRARGGHFSNKLLNIWLAERVALAESAVEDLLFHECSHHFPKAKLDVLNTTHTVLSTITSPQNLGHPTSRRRRLSFAFNKATMCWVGPSDFDTDYRRQLYCDPGVISADYLMIDGAGIRLEAASLAKAKTKHTCMQQCSRMH